MENAASEFDALDTFDKIKAVAATSKIVKCAMKVPVTVKEIFEELKEHVEASQEAIKVIRNTEELKKISKAAEGSRDAFNAYVKAYGEP